MTDDAMVDTIAKLISAGEKDRETYYATARAVIPIISKHIQEKMLAEIVSLLIDEANVAPRDENDGAWLEGRNAALNDIRQIAASKGIKIE